MKNIYNIPVGLCSKSKKNVFSNEHVIQEIDERIAMYTYCNTMHSNDGMRTRFRGLQDARDDKKSGHGPVESTNHQQPIKIKLHHLASVYYLCS